MSSVDVVSDLYYSDLETKSYNDHKSTVWNGRDVTFPTSLKKERDLSILNKFNQHSRLSDFSIKHCMSTVSVEGDFERDYNGDMSVEVSGHFDVRSEDGKHKGEASIKVDDKGNVKADVKYEAKF